jgi:hypothetical protein
MLGRAAVAMWWDIAPEIKAEFEDWHTHEHMPERLAIPGFLRGTRWIALSAAPSYFMLYETARWATVTQGAYLERLNNPTAWSSKMMPHHRNMVRSLCRLRASFGGGVPAVMATLRFSPKRGQAGVLSGWLAAQLPELVRRPGLVCAHLLASQASAGSARTKEQEIRGNDARADWIVLVGGYDADAVQATVAGDLGADAFAAHGATAPAEGVYRPAYCLAARDMT